jgi:hypothetical protein
MLDWIGFAVSLLDLVPVLAERRRARDAHIEETITALREAYLATVEYEEALAAGDPRSRAQEFALARSWENFATKIRRYDEGLFNRLRLKGRFWREGGCWDEATRHDAKIGLERIRQDAELQLLVKQPLPRV